MPSADTQIKEESDPDIRLSQADEDKLIEPKNEYFDGDQDNDKTENVRRLLNI